MIRRAPASERNQCSFKALVSELAVEALYEAVLLGLPRVDEMQPDAPLVGPLVERPAGQFRTVVEHNDARDSAPFLGRRSSTRATRTPGSEVSTSIARDSRWKTSSIVSIRIFRPQDRASLTKSRHQSWSGPAGA